LYTTSASPACGAPTTGYAVASSASASASAVMLQILFSNLHVLNIDQILRKSHLKRRSGEIKSYAISRFSVTHPSWTGEHG